ncbi:MAG: hypothetical protein ABIP08_10530 [Lautropia sp.]
MARILRTRADDPGRPENPAGGLSRSQGPWRQPVVWLGVALFAASLGGCVLMIVLAMRHRDPPPPDGVDVIMKMPVNRIPTAASR